MDEKKNLLKVIFFIPTGSWEFPTCNIAMVELNLIGLKPSNNDLKSDCNLGGFYRLCIMDFQTVQGKKTKAVLKFWGLGQKCKCVIR